MIYYNCVTSEKKDICIEFKIMTIQGSSYINIIKGGNIRKTNNGNYHVDLLPWYLTK